MVTTGLTDNESSQGRAHPAETESLQWEPGDVIHGLYEVQSKLGEGGMGRVYSIRHRGWNSDLAVKVPKKDGALSTKGYAAFEQECDLWINLGWHQHVVPCHFVRRFGDVPIVFMELLAAGSLAHWIKSGRLYAGDTNESLERILSLAIQSALGLHHAHSQGLIHQDVKPANMLLASDGMLKITDFGLARAREDCEEEPFAGGAPHAAGMTPAYCSPEQAEGMPLTVGTDIWSWAVSVLEMLIGEMRWISGEAAPHVLDACFGGDRPVGPRKPVLANPPARLLRLLRNCLQERVAQRPPDMHAIVLELTHTYEESVGTPYADLSAGSKGYQEHIHGLANYNNRAISLVELGQEDEAEVMLRRAYLEMKKSSPTALGSHAQTVAYNFCLLRIQRAGDISSQTIRELLPTASDPGRHAFLAAMLLLKAGYLAETIELLENAAAEDSNYLTDALNVRGIALLLVGETRPALACFAAAVEQAPERLDILRNMALAYYYEGHTRMALRIFAYLASRSLFDAEDAIRYAAILAASGLNKRAARWLWEAVGVEGRSSTVDLTAAELASGCQNFLPWVVPVAKGMGISTEWVARAIAAEPANLRARVDADTLPSRYSLRIGPLIKNRERILFKKGASARVAGNIVSSYQALTKRHRWGHLPKRFRRAQLILLSGLPAMLAAVLVGLILAGGNAQDASLVGGTAFAAAFVLTMRGAPSNNLSWEIARLVPFGAVPVLVGLSPLSEQFPILNETALLMFVPASLMVFVVWQIVYQRLTTRIRAFPQNSAVAALLRPSRMLIRGPNLTELKSHAAGRNRKRNLRAAVKTEPFELLFGLLMRRVYGFLPGVVRTWRKASAAFWGWQIYLLPQVFVFVYLMNFANPEAAYIIYLPFLIMPILLAFFSPWLTLTLNVPASVYLAVQAGNVFIQEHGALIGIGAALEETASLDFQRTLMGLVLAALFTGLSWRAFVRCPEFIPEWTSCDARPWDIDQIVDPLDIRKYAAPWQLVRPETAAESSKKKG